MSNSQRPHGLQPTKLLCPWDFPGKSTGVGCHCLLQNYYTVALISHASKVMLKILQARILERVAISFSRGFSRPRNQIWVFCIAEARWSLYILYKRTTLSEQAKLGRVISSNPALRNCVINYSLNGYLNKYAISQYCYSLASTRNIDPYN